MESQWLILFAILLLVQLGTTSPIYSTDTQSVQSMNIQNTTSLNYSANVFNSLLIKKPENWYALNAEELYGGFPNIYSPIKIDYNTLYEKFIEIYPQPIIPLFGYMKYPFGKQYNKFNPSIVGILMNMTGQTNLLENNCDIFIYSDQLFMGKPLLIITKSDCDRVDINGEEFATQELTLNILDAVIIKQTQYAKKINNDYFFVCTLMYADERDKKQLETIMRSIRFSN